MGIDNKRAFEEKVWSYYLKHGRHDLPWRLQQDDGSFDPYRVLVSEIMLQQTQVNRVIPKFTQFIDTFPNTYALAHASLAEVLLLWNGLGYNRRAKFLWQAARMIEAEYDGIFPKEVTELKNLPGVGSNTAGAVMAYAFNEPVVFIETNIRTVFIHHFFPKEVSVTDAMLTPLIAATVDTTRAREWYWALMDYGTYVKQTEGNASRTSETYTRQSPFQGSRRQLRGAILRTLLEQPKSEEELAILFTDERRAAVLHDLVQEGLIQLTHASYAISSAA